MLTGKVPFDADTPVSIALKHMQEEPKPAIEVNPNIPTAVNDIVMKAMRKEPDDRYQTATEMLADLSKALKDPEGDFVVLENEDGGYSRVIKGVNASDVKRSKSGAKSGKNGKKQNIFQKYPKLKIPAAILALVAIFFAVFGITKIAMDGFDSSVELPNLVGMTKEEAQKACDEKGLKFLIGEPIASNDIEKDKVAKQDPEFKDKKKVEKGTEIKVSISTGKEEHELPDWAGKTISEVEAEAEKFGLTINKIEEPSDKVEKGKVISTETKAGVIVVSGDTINVHVSTGKKKTKVPSLIGLTENQAKNMLTNAHLKAKVEYQTDESQADKKDCVIKQSEEQDSEVDEDTEITITINAIDDPKKAKFAITVNATYAGTQPTASAELTVMVNDKKAGKETVNFTAASKTKSFTVTTESDKAVKITVVDDKGNVVGGPKTSEDPKGWDEGVTIPESISVTIKDATPAQ
jgi:serine/threonine-protein kinase